MSFLTSQSQFPLLYNGVMIAPTLTESIPGLNVKMLTTYKTTLDHAQDRTKHVDGA